ncbi:MAG: SDR family NAD(P)-dependent oxidoreductase [Cardiobacteriaceae bacterium]|nr:SDR family NAD(P)-dependent oxidoreductase [Cardiobacteriaceae bacterium]
MKTILLTGACGGIGHALAKALDAQGHHLLLLDLDPLALEALDAELNGDHTLVPFDLWRSGYDAYVKLAELIKEDHGKLDAVIHLATVCGGLRPLVHDDPESWLQGLQVNITAPLWLFQTQRELLLAAEAPRVIFSLHHQHQQQGAYWHSFGVAQHALESMVETLYAEKHAYPNIGFACVDSGWVDTPFSRAVYPAGQAHWRQAAEVVSLYLDALAGSPEQLEQYV